MRQFSLAYFARNQSRITAFLIGLLIIICLYDLLSPPISVTIMRQTQTAMLTDNFLNEGFSLKGLYTNINGHDKLRMAFEFPLYNFIVGLLFKLFNNNPFWGKLVSLFAEVVSLVIFLRLVRSISDDLTAFYASLFFILFPVNVLMSTSFQPDALGLMFLLLSIFMLDRWRNAFSILFIIGFSVSLLLCGLCKYPLLVPYIPVCILMFLFSQGKFRFPRAAEILIFTVLFIIPFISWYLYRSSLTDPMFLACEFEMFLIGDLKRFLSLTFYIRPAIMLGMLIFCGSGVFYFILGLKRISAVGFALLIGIPLYYIIVPTVAGQYYYLYAITPIVAFFMAKGVSYIASYFKRRRTSIFSYALCLIFGLFALFGITYVLRMDRVILPASEAMREVSDPEDLIFVVNMHDRGVSVGGVNTGVFYFAGRKGWNIQNFNPDNLEGTIAQINYRRDEGARWLLITWYTPDMEPWYSKFLPNEFKRLLGFDSKAIADSLKRRYFVARSGNNFAILNLTQKGI